MCQNGLSGESVLIWVFLSCGNWHPEICIATHRYVSVIIIFVIMLLMRNTHEKWQVHVYSHDKYSSTFYYNRS